MTTTTLPHQLPLSKRKRARMDRHNERQRRYEKGLSEKKAPTREAVAAVALDLVLGVIEDHPQTKQARMARGALIDQLVAVGFSKIQCEIKLDAMCERLEKHRAWRRHLRQLAAQNETAADGAASAADAM